ncbi:MAG TPA: hypothetical protein DCS05_09440 [Nitrospiraceae bacterium]|nr:hypothetical protein [Nitrospiraceae bacterium]
MGKGPRVEFQHLLHREEYIRTKDRIIIAARRLRHSSVTLFFSLLLFAGLPGASAETAGQPGTNSAAADGDLVSAETTPRQDPSAPAAPQEPEPGKTPQPVAQTKTEKRRLGPQVDPCFTAEVAGDNWLDQVHGYVQDSTCEPAVWFDTFFVKDHVLLDLRPGTLIIVRNSVRWTEGQGVTNLFDYHLEWKLPQWKKFLKRSKLYFESRSVADKYTTQPGQPVQPGVDRKTGVRKPVIGVRADLYTRFRSLVSINSGIKISAHTNAHIRLRYQYVNPFGDVYVFRFSEIAMWQSIEHFSNTVQLDLERKFSTLTFDRWANNVTYLEDTPGVTWNTGVSLFTALSSKSAISFDTNMWGVSHPHWVTQNYRVGSLYRRSFYRHWLFFELAPEVTWPKGAGGHRNSTYAFMATLEIQFGK